MEICERLLCACHRVEFPARCVICQSGEAIENAYFVNTGLASFHTYMEDGRSVEIGSVGAEGGIGVGAAFEANRAVRDCVAQLPTTALRIARTVLQREMSAHDTLRDAVIRYRFLFSDQLAQVSACNRLHSLQQRFCHWLLVLHDGANCGQLRLSHETLALLLGVQRPSVSTTSERLRQRSLIDYSHGRITILDRAALEENACECYRMRRERIDQAFDLHRI